MSGSGPVGPACTLLHIQVDEHGFTMPFTGCISIQSKLYGHDLIQGNILSKETQYTSPRCNIH